MLVTVHDYVPPCKRSRRKMMRVAMETRLQKVDPEHFRAEELREACGILRNGGLVAFPTETVYGLGGDAFRPEAAARIYAAKGRPSDNPLIVHIADMEALEHLATHVSGSARCLAECFWPGPLTMIFSKNKDIPAATTGGLETVAVRMPQHPVALALIRGSGVCIAAPSANRSGRPSPTRAEHVLEDLNGRVDMILDGGVVGIGLESTIVDMSGERPMILRPGAVTEGMLERVVGTVQTDPAVAGSVAGEPAVARAPGMKYRHYAPRGQMVIVEGQPEKVVDKINDLVRDGCARGQRVAVIAAEETRPCYSCDLVYCPGSHQREGSIAAGLYDILREMDSLGVEYIFAESFEQDALGEAIMNRMYKAAAYHVIQV